MLLSVIEGEALRHELSVGWGLLLRSRTPAGC